MAVARADGGAQGWVLSLASVQGDEVTLYVGALNTAQPGGLLTIAVAKDPDPASHGTTYQRIHIDKVRYTTFDFGLDVDSNNDGSIGTQDDYEEEDSHAFVFEGDTYGLRVLQHPFLSDYSSPVVKLKTSVAGHVTVTETGGGATLLPGAPTGVDAYTFDNGDIEGAGTLSYDMAAGDPNGLGEVDLSVAISTGVQIVAHDWVRVMVVRVTIAHPTGDPTSSPAPATSEFVYDAEEADKLKVDVRVQVEPDNDAVREFFASNLRYEIDAIADSHDESDDVQLEWETAWDSNTNMGKGVYVGGSGLWESEVTFTGLPPSNSDFGPKTVTAQVRYGSDVLWEDSTEIEVFYSRDLDNHPGDDESAPDADRSPNWFYYWKRAIGAPGGTVVLFHHDPPTPGNASPLGVTPAMVLWQPPPDQLHPKNEIWIGPLARLVETRRDGSDQEVSGIDLFANVMLHEAEHVHQIAVADALLANETGTMYANGWSWLLAGGSWNNRFLLGTDGKPGVPDHDDDGGGVVDDTDVPVELGWGWPDMPQGVDDVPLDTDDDFLPDSLDDPDVEGPEGGAYLKETVEEGTYISVDWGSPGKRHGTDAYDD